MLGIAVLTGCSGGAESPAPASEPATAELTTAERATAEPTTAEPATAEAAPETATLSAPAPDFTLLDQDGTEHRLSQYRGRVVVLEWINPGCPYVQRHYEAGTMTRLERELPDEDVVWLAIDSSNFIVPEASRAWRAEHQMAHPILQDPAGDVGRRYAARTTPHMFVIDREGTLRYAGAIDDDPRGRSEAPTNHVAQAVRAVLAGEAPPITTTEPYGCTVKYEGV
jgi:peroxiredoxin